MKSSNVPEDQRQTGSLHQSPNGKMEAIACGVQARLEAKTGYYRRITDETVNIARALGVADREIEKWANQRLNRLAHEEERLREIKSLLDKVGAR
jgi:hypothetical protein